MDKYSKERYNNKQKGVVYMMPSVTKPSVCEELSDNVSKESFSVDDLMELSVSIDYAGKTFQDLYKEGK